MTTIDRTERPCVCGHDIWEHEDYDLDIHECNHDGCGCKQFLDAADGAVIDGGAPLK